MSQNIRMEAELLCLSLITGMGLMAAYDVLRIFRLLVRHGWLWTGVEDFCYWLTAGLVTFYLLYRENDGSIRWYVIATVLLTMVAYNRIFSCFLLKLLKKAGRWIKIKLMRKKKY